MKFILAILGGVALTGCGILPQKNIYTEIDIHTPRQVVWEILMNNKSYPTWNPYHVVVEGQLKVGEQLSLVIHKPNNSEIHIKPWVMDVIEFELLSWGGGVTGIFHGKHVFELQSINEFTTRLIHRETFSGIAIPFAELDTIEEGYNLMNEALKRRAEANFNMQKRTIDTIHSSK